MKTNKYWAGFGTICGILGTGTCAYSHQLGWTLAGLGATGINLLSLFGVFDDTTGE